MTRKMDPVGYCIYCGASSVQLSGEHVVPFALGGDVILPDASCSVCAAITSKFEMYVAREVLGPFRTRTEAPTRRPKRRPTELNLELVNSDGSCRNIKLNPSSHPAALVLPVLPEPLILMPALNRVRRDPGMFVALPDTSVLSIPLQRGAVAMNLGSFKIECFYRLLAKIAHAAAYLDPNWTSCWEPLLRDFILGHRQDYDCCVGGSETDEFKDDESSFPLFFRAFDKENERYLVAYFRLFGPNETPTYQVVVGRLRKART